MQPDLRKCLLLIVLFCSCTLICAAQQEKENASIRFRSINQLGLLDGQTGSAWQMQTINGVQYKSWFGGIGAGLDYYRFRGIPVFADLRKTFGHTRNKLFLYADGGIHFTQATDKEKMPYTASDHFSNGVYLDGGAGYQIHISRRNALLLSLGYSYKTVRETTTGYYYLPLFGYYNVPDILTVGGLPAPQTNIYNYHLNRISIKLGWSFN